MFDETESCLFSAWNAMLVYILHIDLCKGDKNNFVAEWKLDTGTEPL